MVEGLGMMMQNWKLSALGREIAASKIDLTQKCPISRVGVLLHKKSPLHPISGGQHPKIKIRNYQSLG